MSGIATIEIKAPSRKIFGLHPKSFYDYASTYEIGAALSTRGEVPNMQLFALDNDNPMHDTGLFRESHEVDLFLNVKVPMSELERASAATKKENILCVFEGSQKRREWLLKLSNLMEERFGDKIEGLVKQPNGKKRKALTIQYKHMFSKSDKGDAVVFRAGVQPDAAAMIVAASKAACDEYDKDMDYKSIKMVKLNVHVNLTVVWLRVSNAVVEWSVSKSIPTHGSGEAVKFVENVYPTGSLPASFHDPSDEEEESASTPPFDGGDDGEADAETTE